MCIFIFSLIARIYLIIDRAIAWVGSVVKANDVHPIAECSNKGICDRTTGFCECFSNFEGDNLNFFPFLSQELDRIF